MPGVGNSLGSAGVLAIILWLVGACSYRGGAQSRGIPEPTTVPVTVTNLAQLCRIANSPVGIYGRVSLELVVCATSRPGLGVVAVRDSTGVELLQLGRRLEALLPGDKIRLGGAHLWLRPRELGTQISSIPLVDNDGLHMSRVASSVVFLQAGRVPLELDWFNNFRNFALEISYQPPNGPPRHLPDFALWHAADAGAPPLTHEVAGLRVECFRGSWDQVPDFDLLQPDKIAISPNFNLDARSQDEMVGLRFTGFFEASITGRYLFRVRSDDGSLLFIGPSDLALEKIGRTIAPPPQAAMIGQGMDGLQERRWISVSGRVSFVSRRDAGLDLELRSGAEVLSVSVADAAGLDPGALLHASVRAVGVGRAALSAGHRVVLDRLYVASGADLTRVSPEPNSPGQRPRLLDIGQVQAMQVPEAERQVPVRVRGVVTAANRSDHWAALQDDTRGIFVDLHAFSNSFPARAELYEVIGHTAPGNFAPVIVAEQLTGLGRGRLPEPARPSWNELANGSMDVQWVEFQGLVSEVHSNMLDLLLPAGALQVRLEGHFEPELTQYVHAVVRIRGALFAIWNADTREVQFGSVLMRDATVDVDTPPAADPFDAPTKTARDLLLFDARASAFRPVKVRAQVVYSDAQRVLAVEQGMGLRVLTADAAVLRPGDYIEAVGYPEISGPSPQLRQARVRKIGAGPLPPPVVLSGPDSARKGLDSTLVRLEAKLIDMHSEQNAPVLELQSHGELFMARLKPGVAAELPLRLGSKLELSGVVSESGAHARRPSQVEPFELLISSPADIRVLSEPSWWTLGRLGAVVGILLVVLVLAAAWIHQLRRQVEQRTAQLQCEIRERERAERHQALEAERSRIARDLHDDLGSSLTEIGVLASTGQRAHAAPGAPSELFDAIAGRARGSIAALDVIVWAVDPEDNSLQSLADYLSGFAREYLAAANVVCRFKIPVSLPPIRLEGRLRHDLFLAVKESLNNIVRHAHAEEVELGIAVTEGALELTIADNGNGFVLDSARDGNGLKNLRSRLTELGGTCDVGPQPGRGTVVRLRLPLPVNHEKRDLPNDGGGVSAGGTGRSLA